MTKLDTIHWTSSSGIKLAPITGGLYGWTYLKVCGPGTGVMRTIHDFMRQRSYDL